MDPVELDNPGTETEGAVASVDPDGELQEGDPVTVSYYGQSAGAGGHAGQQPGPRGARTTASATAKGRPGKG